MFKIKNNLYITKATPKNLNINFFVKLNSKFKFVHPKHQLFLLKYITNLLRLINIKNIKNEDYSSIFFITDNLKISQFLKYFRKFYNFSYLIVKRDRIWINGSLSNISILKQKLYNDNQRISNSAKIIVGLEILDSKLIKEILAQNIPFINLSQTYINSSKNYNIGVGLHDKPNLKLIKIYFYLILLLMKTYK